MQKKGNDTGFILVVHNPSDARSRLISFKHPSPNIASKLHFSLSSFDLWLVIDESGKTFTLDIFCERRDSTSNDKDCEIFFVDRLPGFTFKTYFITRTNKSSEIFSSKIRKEYVAKLSNGSEVSIDFTGKTINYKNCRHFNSCINESFSLNYKYYESSTKANKSSGCYLFVPTDSSPEDYGRIIDVEVAEGSDIIQFKVSSQVVISTNAEARFQETMFSQNSE